MSNSDTVTDTRSDKRSALDDFATAPARDIVSAPSVQPMASPGDRVFGAQPVAVYRDEARILQKLAALGAAAGDDWFYRFPVKNKNGGKDFIEGASIKLANDVARIYGNCEVDTRVIDLGPSWLIYARFTDFESGFALTRPFQQNKNASKMGGDADRKLDISFQIGVSKAIRNVVVNALQTFSDFAFEAARNSLIDKIGKDVKKWQEKTLQGLANHGVDAQRVEFVIGRAAKDWTAPDLAKIIAMMKAIADGMATIDETFPPKDKQVGEDIDRETGEVTDRTNSTASTEPGAHSEAGAGTAGQADPSQTGSGPDKASSADKSTGSSQAGGTTAPAASGQAATNAESPDPSKAEATGKVAAMAPIPKTEAEYVGATTAWIDVLTDADAGEKRWKDEKSLRNKANVGADARESLQEKLAAKCGEIRDADRS
jgi:hypothetical protein